MTATVLQVEQPITRVVVMAPHPDDETLSTGLLLARLSRRGIPTVVVAVTDGEAAYPDHDPGELAHRRTQEQEAALAALGHPCSSVIRARIPDGRVHEHCAQLAGIVRDLVEPHTLLVAPSLHDWHPDHVGCGSVAVEVAGSRGCTLWASLFWAHHHPEGLIGSDPSLFVIHGRRDEHADRSRALAEHRSQFVRPGSTPILDAALVAHLSMPIETYVRCT